MAWRHDARPPAGFLLHHWQWNGLVRAGLAGVCQRTSASRGAALGCRTQWHQLQHCPKLWARDWGRHSRLCGGRRRIHHERASLSAPPDRLVLLASSEGAVAVAAGKTGASGRFGSSLHRPLAANSNCPWADLGYRNCRRFSLSGIVTLAREERERTI